MNLWGSVHDVILLFAAKTNVSVVAKVIVQSDGVLWYTRVTTGSCERIVKRTKWVEPIRQEDWHAKFHLRTEPIQHEIRACTGVALRLISAYYIAQQNLAVRKIAGGSDACSVRENGTRSQRASNSRSRKAFRVLWKGSAHPLRTTFDFVESFYEPGGQGAFEMRHSCLAFFSLLRNFCTQIFRSLAYAVRIFSKASGTAVAVQPCRPPDLGL